MLKLLLSLTFFISFGAHALTGTLFCEVIHPINLGINDVTIVSTDETTSVLINGRDEGFSRLGRLTDTDYKLTVITKDYIELLELNFTTEDFLQGALIRGVMAYGLVILDETRTGEVLYEKTILNCSPVIPEA